MFHRDILLVDIECTGLDPAKHEIIQLAALLLDKKTLEEKANISVYVKPTKWKNRDPESMAINKLSLPVLKTNGVSLKAAIDELDSLMKKPVVLAYWAGDFVDGPFLKAAYHKLGRKYPLDYHSFNIWPLAFAFMAKKNKLIRRSRPMGFTTQDICDQFNITPLPKHDALNDCRNEAALLRGLIKHITA